MSVYTPSHFDITEQAAIARPMHDYSRLTADAGSVAVAARMREYLPLPKPA